MFETNTNYNTVQTVWNMDGAVSQAIFELKMKFLRECFENDFTTAYWTLLSIKSEFSAKLTDPEYGELVELTNDLSTLAQAYLMADYDDNTRMRFQLGLMSYYEKLCKLMKEHGLYFREQLDPSRAILRR